MKTLLVLASLTTLLFTSAPAQVTFPGGDGPGMNKHIVLLAGDEEYRSEEVMPMLAKILSTHHGFNCTVVWSVDPATGDIDPNESHNLPGLEALSDAEVCIMLWRFRAPKDEQMKHFVDYLNSGKPLIGLRTSTHAFNYPKDSTSPYARFGWTHPDWKGGFGKQVLGETWLTHWGVHKKEATRGVIEDSAKDHPILRGVTNVFGDSDVYEAYPPDDARILMRGEVLSGITADTPPATHEKERVSDKQKQPVNDPMMPVVWTREYKGETGNTTPVLTSTMGCSTDFLNEDLRRLVVNACYHYAGLEVPEKAKVDFVGEFTATPYGFNTFVKGKKPSDYAW